ncbi:MAG: response regulator transcription factor [Thermoanaerobaculia bacterium]
MNDSVRLLLVDDHEIVREGLRTLLEQEDGIEVVGEGEDGEQAIRLARSLEPDVVLMDVLMPGIGGIEATRRLAELPAPPRVLVLTSVAEESAIREAIAAGALGYLMKDVSRHDLVRAIRDAARNRPTLDPEAQRVLMRKPEPSPLAGLTPRELSVLELVAEGRSNRQIGNRLGLTEGTVKGYVSILLDKLSVQDRTQAALLAVQHLKKRTPGTS